MIGPRSFGTLLKSLAGPQHYAALWQMYRTCPAFADTLRRYLLAVGSYPHDVLIHTPIGPVTPRLYSHHDLLTVNEVFFRQDYYVDASPQVILDIGANIGISALYFLTRSRGSTCYLYEPDPRNVAKLQHTLSGCASQFVLKTEAVADKTGLSEFGIERTGGYGGLDRRTGESIQVRCVHINEVLGDLLARHPSIDLVKIDTEGTEVHTILAIKEEFLRRINSIYLESRPATEMHPALFEQRQYGSICQLSRRRSA